nr:uncharacterized protein CI109_006275 [Kwoniella shandongensis]KAA5525376.1 hypothetical protein CI109_006275 [Kwoniella shandongensis]
MPIFKRYSAGTGVQNRPTFAETLCGLPLIAQGRTTIQMSIVRPESKYLPDDDEAGRSSSSRPSKDKGKAASGTSSSVKKGNHHRKGHGHGHGKKTEKG